MPVGTLTACGVGEKGLFGGAGLFVQKWSKCRILAIFCLNKLKFPLIGDFYRFLSFSGRKTRPNDGRNKYSKTTINKRYLPVFDKY